MRLTESDRGKSLFVVFREGFAFLQWEKVLESTETTPKKRIENRAVEGLDSAIPDPHAFVGVAGKAIESKSVFDFIENALRLNCLDRQRKKTGEDQNHCVQEKGCILAHQLLLAVIEKKHDSHVDNTSGNTDQSCTAAGNVRTRKKTAIQSE